MTERDFVIKSTGRKVRWKTGQPLGLLSSFPSFALWHHDIIQFAYNRENFRKGKPLRFFKDYRLIGDDVVIFNKEVSVAYQEILNDLGVPINLSKSVLGNALDSQIEFTKRFSLRGKEMSSIKRNLLTKNDKHSLLDLIDILLSRDFISPGLNNHFDLFNFLDSREAEDLNFIL